MASCAVGTSALAGCNAPWSGPDEMLSLEVINTTEELQRITVDLFRDDRDERGDAYVYSRRFMVSAPGDDAVEHVREEDIAQVRRYQVFVDVHQGPTTTYPFYPSYTGDPEIVDELVVKLERPDASEVTFRQNVCG